MTPEQTKCFCESKGATGRVESYMGVITYSAAGVEVGIFTAKRDRIRAIWFLSVPAPPRVAYVARMRGRFAK